MYLKKEDSKAAGRGLDSPGIIYNYEQLHSLSHTYYKLIIARRQSEDLNCW